MHEQKDAGETPRPAPVAVFCRIPYAPSFSQLLISLDSHPRSAPFLVSY